MTEALQLPPHDLEAEAAVISCVLVEPAGLRRVADILRPEHFYSGHNRTIYAECLKMTSGGGALDSVTVLASLRASGQLGSAGGLPYIMGCLDAAPVISDVRRYAIIVHDRWRARSAVAIGQRLVARGYEGVADVQSFLQDITGTFARLTRTTPENRFSSNREVLASVMARMNATVAPGDKPRGIPTGIDQLDRILGGLEPGSKTTIIAATSVGKTVFSTHIATAAATVGFGVLIFTCGEMTAEELMIRQLAAASSVDSKRIKKEFNGVPTLTVEEWDRITRAGEFVHHLPILVYDKEVTVEDIETKTARVADWMLAEHKVPLALVAVDYVQKVAGGGHLRNAEKRVRVAHTTDRLKTMGQAQNVAVVELSQARAAKVAEPELGEIAAETGDIERTADNVVHLYRKNKHNREAVTGRVVKQRSGEVDSFELRINYQFARVQSANDPLRAASRDFVDGNDNELTRGL